MCLITSSPSCALGFLPGTDVHANAGDLPVTGPTGAGGDPGAGVGPLLGAEDVGATPSVQSWSLCLIEQPAKSGDAEGHGWPSLQH